MFLANWLGGIKNMKISDCMPELPVVTARASEQIKSGSLLAHFCEVSKSWFL